jgi:Tat protein translocase TatB subunit
VFGLGFQEIIVIAILALLLLGPKKLPELMSQLGRFMRDFQHAADDVKRELTRPTEEMKAPLQAAKDAVDRTLNVYDPDKNPEHAKVASEIAGTTKPVSDGAPTSPESAGPDKPQGLAG